VIEDTKTLTVADPRTFDGDPFDVAGRACEQARALAALTAHSIESVEIVARNAQMTRWLAETDGEDAKASEWDDSPQGRQFKQITEALQAVGEDLDEVARRLGTLAKAAAYKP
jgi:hypothetical protein